MCILFILEPAITFIFLTTLWPQKQVVNITLTLCQLLSWCTANLLANRFHLYTSSRCGAASAFIWSRLVQVQLSFSSFFFFCSVFSLHRLLALQKVVSICWRTSCGSVNSSDTWRRWQYQSLNNLNCAGISFRCVLIDVGQQRSIKKQAEQSSVPENAALKKGKKRT